MRFHISELIGITTVAALAITSLVFGEHAPLYESVFLSLTLGGILFGVAVAIGCRGIRQRTWASFSACAVMYVVFSHFPDSSGNVPRRHGPEITTAILQSAYEWKVDSQVKTKHFDKPMSNGLDDRGVFDSVFGDRPAADPNEIITLVYDGQNGVRKTGNPPVFFRIGHCAWALLIGWVAAHVTQAVSASQLSYAVNSKSPHKSRPGQSNE